MPGESVGEAFVTIRADTTGFESEAKRTVGGVLTGLATGFAAIKVGQFFKSAFNEAEEAQKVFAQTEAVIKSTGGAAGVTAKQVGDYAGKLSDLAAIDDEVIQSGENMLLTFKNIGSEIFNRTTKATLDLAAGMAASSGGTIDMKASAIQLGKALNDPVAGISALTRVGVQFTEQQKEQIATLVASGDVLGAQKIILKEVEAQFAGSAAAQATDSAKLQVAYGNLKESLGTALLPAINAVANALTPLAKWLAENKAVAAAFAVVVGGALVAAFTAWAISAASAAVATFAAISPIVLLGAAIVALIAGAALLYLKWDEVWSWMRDHPAIAAIIILLTSTITVPIIALVGLLRLMQGHWDDVWSVMQSAALGAWSVIGPVFAALDAAIFGVIGAIDWIAGNAASAFDGFRDSVVSMWNVVDGPLGFIVDALQRIINVAGRVKGALDSIPSFIPGGGGGIVPNFVPGIGGFATGGVVPGPKGAPMLAVVHGQEEVLTPAQREAQAGGGTAGLTIQGDLIIQDREVIPTLDYWAATRMAGV